MKRWYVDVMLVEAVIIDDAESQEDAIAKAQQIPASAFDRVECEWAAEAMDKNDA